jgi:hypothetical protein
VAAARSRISLALRMSEDSKDGSAPPAQKAMPSLDELAAGQGASTGAKETSAKEEEKPGQYAVKLDKSGAGFNQFDPVLSATSFVSRRFGLVGGLAVVALLASTEGKDIVKALLAEKAKEGTGEVFETENGVEYEDLLIGPPGEGKEPAPGKLVGMTVEVTIADQKFKKNVAFKYGSKPYTSLVCEGLEEGIEGMRVGGRRKVRKMDSFAVKF